MVKVLIGDIFESRADALVNTVNTVGVMGKGIALGFRKRFPEMYEDYVRRCERREVRLGKPYLYRRVVPPHIINFPTKEHWRSVSRLDDIVAGLRHLQTHVQEWNMTSLAVPPLGCGEGQLEWRVVGPTLYRALSQIGIPAELYAPFGTPQEELQPEFLGYERPAAAVTNGYLGGSTPPFRVEPGWVALVAILEQVSKERYHWPVGRVGFQKVAYFATEAGIPTGLSYRRGSYGPYAPGMKQVLSRLINNGLVVERKTGRMLSTNVGPTYDDARRGYQSFLVQWQPKIDRVVDLVVRMNTDDAEIAATVHFAANRIREANKTQPTESQILGYVMQWKFRRRPPLDEGDVALAIRRLNVLGWIDAGASDDLPLPEEAMIA
ncbi:MAG TPA: macro domain-containing protein [Terriglobales bacterium]|nr:macro domain-containing protein [Terriglobales bacterium]